MDRKLDDLIGNERDISNQLEFTDFREEDIRSLYWKYRGLKLELKRQMDFWQATNSSLKRAYEQLDDQGKELETLYSQLQEDLQVAHQVQDALLPDSIGTNLKGCSVSTYYKQLNEVGGDYFDIFKLPNNESAIGIFDISGHGVASSLIMGYLKALFTEATKRISDPAELVSEVNDRCLPFFKRIKKYSTVNFIRFSHREFHYVTGGGYGYLINGDQGIRLSRNAGFLGLRSYKFTKQSMEFSTGSILALYTDGIIEAQNRYKQDYTQKRLNGIILSNAHRHVDDILDRCLWDYRRFRQADSDDLLLMIIRKESDSIADQKTGA